MPFFEVFFIALALSADAFAVSIAHGISAKKMPIGDMLRIGLCFGAFQALMPLVGWTLGSLAAQHVKTFDHWIAFVLLVAVGAKMVYEATRVETEQTNSAGPLTALALLTLGVATSIDAAAVGVTLSFLGVLILKPVFIVGIVTFTLSCAGAGIGKRLGKAFEGNAELIGGVFLIGYGTKILVEHLYFQ